MNRTSRRPRTWLLATALLFASSSRAQVESVYVPVVNVYGASLGGHATAWVSTVAAFNSGAEPVRLTVPEVYGSQSSGFCPPNIIDPLPSASGRVLRDYTAATPPPGLAGPFCLFGGPAFAEFRAPSTVSLTALVYRVSYVERGFPLPPIVLPLASARLPVFLGLFPPGSRVVSDDLPFSAVDAACPSGAEECHRMNLTLLNAGAEPATFTVRALKGDPAAEPEELVYSVPARDVLQTNRLPFASGAYWLVVTATQPFLCYASTVLEGSLGVDPVVRVSVAGFRVLP